MNKKTRNYFGQLMTDWQKAGSKKAQLQQICFGILLLYVVVPTRK
jgi:hypothetical protein